MKDEALINALSQPVPRYTSYPTAPNFSNGVDAAAFSNALQSLSPQQPLSLYFHIPFCHQLCWYCGCHARVANSKKPIERYVQDLLSEIGLVRKHLKGSPCVSHVHFGGGSPNRLTEGQFARIMTELRNHFQLTQDTEVAVELDPRWLTKSQIAAFAENGVTRASLGVQDFDENVQRAINRQQSFKQTKDAVDGLRAAGIGNINIDLVYGLPHQTRRTLTQTISDVLKLAPNRIALFGYAHLPQKIRHQRLIDDAAVPGALDRYAQCRRAQRLLQRAGYVPLGVDHFAKPHDPITTTRLRRNFQGYTTDSAPNLIGLGASSISHLSTGYYQNLASPRDYQAAIQAGKLATTRGIELSHDDILRGFVIERLMCDYEFSEINLAAKFGASAVSHLVEEAKYLANNDKNGIVEKTVDGFRVTSEGKPFVRSIAACFDAYLSDSPNAQYSVGV